MAMTCGKYAGTGKICCEKILKTLVHIALFSQKKVKCAKNVQNMHSTLERIQKTLVHIALAKNEKCEK